MSMIDDIKRDREAGTDGPWRIKDCDSMGDRCTHYYQEVWNDETDILVTTEVTRAHNDGGTANMRRIARVPDMEAALIEAVEALQAWDQYDTRPDDGPNAGIQMMQDYDRALRLTRAAIARATGADT